MIRKALKKFSTRKLKIYKMIGVSCTLLLTFNLFYYGILLGPDWNEIIQSGFFIFLFLLLTLKISNTIKIKQTAKMEKLKPQISTLLRKADIEGLLQNGAPADEYDSEAEVIALALAKLDEINTENITAMISTVWKKSFGLEESELQLRLPAIQEFCANAKHYAEGIFVHPTNELKEYPLKSKEIPPLPPKYGRTN